MSNLLEQRITGLFLNPPEHGYIAEHEEVFDEFKNALNAGSIRAAEKYDGTWRANLWVKKGILLGFRMGALKNFSINDGFRYFDKHTFPLKHITIESGVRVVPGGSSIRDGVHLGKGITCMPPMYINVGAFVDDGTMVDSHALVGSCAQIGKRVHLSAAAQIGGVLEPIGALPVIIEDEVLIGGNCGVFEGTIVREGAVLGAGTILTGSTPVYDLVKQQVYRRDGDRPLEIPEHAVVVPGSRPVTSGWGKDLDISLYTPVIVKYRDSKTHKGIQLEDLLR
jgi:2,3,4,5-tetrahydropyridine-2-carboxylate N-succinyltransferase